MKKNLLSLLLVVVLMMTMLGGCGSDNKVNESGAEKAAEAEEKNGSQESDGASQKNGADNVTIDIFRISQKWQASWKQRPSYTWKPIRALQSTLKRYRGMNTIRLSRRR